MGNWFWAVILLAAAIAIGFLELFLPSGGTLAFLAFTALIASVVFAFMHGITFGLIFLILVVVGTPVLIWYMLQMWPQTPMGRMMMLDPKEDPALRPGGEIEQLKSLIGQTGIAKSRMMPSGQIEIAGRSYDAISEGMPINPGTPIDVIDVQGTVITVRQLPLT